MIPPHPNPIRPDIRAKIAAFIALKAAAGLTVVVPSGVSGMDVLQETSAASWRGNRRGQPKALREKLSKRRRDYRRLVDEGKSGPEIAKIIGVKLQTVNAALRRMRLKIEPKMFEVAGDG